jgi:hypothetical protein
MTTALTNTNEHQHNEKTEPIRDFEFWIWNYSGDDARRRFGLHNAGGKDTRSDDHRFSRSFG